MTGVDTGFHPDSPTRSKIDLNGEWSYSFDGETWTKVKVPSSMDFEGRVMFRRKFSVNDQVLTNSAFKFVALGINNDAEISINDVFVGKHTGAYTSFEFDVPEGALQLGSENVIQIVVQNKLGGRGTIPLRKQVWGWRNYGGIVRDVYLLATPHLWIDDAQIHTAFDVATGRGSATVQLSVLGRGFEGLAKDSTNPKSKPAIFALQIELFEKLSNALVAQSTIQPIQPEQNRIVQEALELQLNSVKPWSPDYPDLYVLQVTLGTMEAKQKSLTPIDQIQQVVGFVHSEFENRMLFVNGVKTMLKGVVYREDYPKFGASLSYEQMEKDIALIKAMGANAVRFGFHPPHPYLINLCDRYGLFVFEELPVVNASGEVLADESFQSLAESMAREMINRDQSSPSVLAWGLGDQCDVNDPRSGDYVRRLATTVKNLDRRPTYFGSKMAGSDACAPYVDLATISLPSIDAKSFKNALLELKKRRNAQPVFLLAYGKEVDHANRNGRSDPMSQEAQAQFFLQYYGLIKEAGIAGSFISSFSDWRGDRPIMTVHESNPFVYPLGLVSYDREKRLAYDVVRTLYNEEKVSAIPVGTYRSSFPFAHVLSGLFVIVLVGYYYGYNRRFSDAVKRSLLRSYNFFADLRDYRTVAIFHTILLAFTISMTLAVILSSILYHYRTDRLADYLFTYFVTSDAVKVLLIKATWNPLIGILSFTGVFFAAFVVFAVIIKLCSLLVRSRIHWFHAYSVTAWGALPIVFLSPVAMSLFKILENPMYVIPSLIIVILFLLWTMARVLKGVSVVYEISPLKTYVGGVVVLAVVVGGMYFYYDSTYALGAYMKMMVHVARGGA